MNLKFLKGAMICMLLSGCSAGAGVETRDTVQVSGQATLRVVPDRARVQFAVEHQAKLVEAAQAEVDAVVERVLALTDRLELERDAVQTTGLQIRPDYQWLGEPRQRSLQGYVVTRQITIALDDVSKLGALMSQAVKAGVNQVQPPTFDLSNRDALEQQALADATQVARDRAQAIVDSLGQTIGAAVSISASDTPIHHPQPQMMMRAAAESSDAAASYEAGQMTITSRVDAVFRLNP